MERVSSQQKNRHISNEKAGAMDVIYYTDPLCCWSYVFEPVWQQLRNTFADQLTFRYCMGGLIPGWSNYNDRVNEVSRPAQMGPLWMQAEQVSGRKIDSTIWAKDPPASSYPVCMAMKCAELQSREAGELYLLLARQSVFENGRNISKYDILHQIAKEIERDGEVTFNASKFGDDMNDGTGLELLRKDIQEVQQKGINRFPSLIIRRENKSSLIIQGLKSIDDLIRIITS